MTDPGDLEVIEIAGEARDLVRALSKLIAFDFALIGGLAVMVRLGGQHRVTGDLDSVFDNPTDQPTTATLVASGVAVDAPPIQRVLIDGTSLDVIDTFALPSDPAALPDDPKDRLFVCAHRFAYETATMYGVKGEQVVARVRVATTAALVATKAHALRFATVQRRNTKRPSDLVDLYRLADLSVEDIVGPLTTAPWRLIDQVADALHADLADLEQVAATVRSSPATELAAIESDELIDILTHLLAAIRTTRP